MGPVRIIIHQTIHLAVTEKTSAHAILDDCCVCNLNALDAFGGDEHVEVHELDAWAGVHGLGLPAVEDAFLGDFFAHAEGLRVKEAHRSQVVIGCYL